MKSNLGSADNSITKTKRIASNTAILFVRMLAITVINLYAVRWVLHGLGIVDYGIFNAIAGIVTTSTCFSSVLALSTQRYFSYAIGQGYHDELQNIFAVSLNMVIILSAIIIITFEIIGLWYINTHMPMPEGRLDIARYVFHISLLTIIISFIQIPYMGAVFSHEHMGVYALVSTTDCVLKFILAYLISLSPTDHLLFYSAGLLLVSLITTAMYMGIAIHRYPECRYKMVKDKHLYLHLFSFSGWTFYGTLSGVGMIQGSIILLNAFFGPIVNAAFGVANQLYNALTTLGNSIVLAFRPAMIKAYSGNNHLYLEDLFNFSNKFILYLLLVVVVPFLFETKYILGLWLGHDNTTANMVFFSQLFVVHCVCLSLHNPITTIMQAIGTIKYYYLCVESLTILCVPISWLLFRFGLPAYWIFYTLIVICVLAHLLRIIILKKYYSRFNVTQYLTGFLLPATGITIIASFVIGKIHGLLPETFGSMILVFVSSIVSFSALIIVIGLNRKERLVLVQFIKNNILN